MDLSEEYIEMCEKAREIQCLRTNDGYLQDGDFYANIKWNKDYKINIAFNNDEIFDGRIWLPRQDQLQELCYKEGYGHHLLDEFIEFYNEYLKPRGFSFSKGNDIDSLEKGWLMFFMRSEHDKVWEDNSWTIFKD